MTVRRLAAAALLLASVTCATAWAASGPRETPLERAAPRTTTSVLVIGVPDLRWEQLSPSRTPAMWGLAKNAARGVLSVRSRTEHTCPDAGWLTLGAGNRAQQIGSSCNPRSTVDDWAQLQRANKQGLDEQQIGALGQALLAAHVCIDADGYAQLATGPTPHRAFFTNRDATSRPCEVTLRETDTAATPSALANADGQVSSLLATHPQSEVLLFGISDSDDQPPHLHVLIAKGQHFSAAAELTSASTDRAPYVQLIDIAPTVLSLVGVPQPEAMAGRPIRPAGPIQDVDHAQRALRDLDLRAQAQRAAVFPWTGVAVVLLLLAVLALLVVSRARRAGGLRWVRAAAVGLGALPGLSFAAQLVPWWRAGHPVLVLVVGCLVGAALIAVALSRNSRAPLIIATSTFVLLGIDLVGPQLLQADAVLGWNPLVAGRFTGVGNPGFAVLASAALLAAAWLTELALGPRIALIVAVAAIAVDGLPFFGADVGGVLALLPATVVLMTVLRGRSLKWRKLIGGLIFGFLVVAGFALLDYQRASADRTHLGRFVERIRSGDALTVLHRKAQANLDLLTHSGFTMLVPLLVVAAMVLVLRPPAPVQRWFDADPTSRAALTAVLTTVLVGAVLNDSGVAIPAVALLVVVPLGMARWIDRGVSGADAAGL